MANTRDKNKSTKNGSTKRSHATGTPSSPEKPPSKKPIFETAAMDVDTPTFVDSDDIPTDPVKASFDITVQLDDSDVPAAKTPYASLFGEGPTAFHDDLRSCSITFAKLFAYPESVDTNLVNRDGLTKDQWIFGFANVINNTFDETSALTIVSPDEIKRLKITASRLSMTPPGKLFSGMIKASRTPATNASKAWYAAIMAVGSHYVKKPKKLTQAKLTDMMEKVDQRDSQKKGACSSTEPASHKNLSPSSVSFSDDLGGDKETDKPTDNPPNNKSDKVHSPPKILNTATGGQTTPTPLPPNRTNPARLVVKIRVDAKEGESPNAVFLQTFKNLLAALQLEDESVILKPWKLSSSSPTIQDPELIPTSITEFRPYADRLSVKNKKFCWFKVYFACNGNPTNLTSSQDSASYHWYQDNNAAAFMATVQDSDNTTELGHLVFSGPFIDHVRVTEQIRLACLRHDKVTQFRFGVRPKKLNEIPKSDMKFTNWTMADNQPLSIEVDKSQARPLKKLLYHLFNKTEDPTKRPGGYNFRILPAKELILAGSSSLKLRADILKKHQAVIQSLNLLKYEDIRDLDKTFTAHNTVYTLRGFVQDITYPLTDASSTHTKLFHSVDHAPSGPDLTSGCVYFTVYNDRLDTAERFLAILPAFVFYKLGHRAASEWFAPHALDVCTEVHFDEDVSGNWTGTWSTTEDRFNQEILDEDMGIEFQIDADVIQLDQTGQNTHTTDEMSVNTFGTAFGKSPPKTSHETPQTQGAASPSEVTEATGSTGAGGLAD